MRSTADLVRGEQVDEAEEGENESHARGGLRVQKLHSTNHRLLALAFEPQGARPGQFEEAGEVEVFGAAGEEHGVAVVQHLAESEAVCVHGSAIDGVSGQGACSDGDGAGLRAEGGEACVWRVACIHAAWGRLVCMKPT